MLRWVTRAVRAVAKDARAFTTYQEWAGTTAWRPLAKVDPGALAEEVRVWWEHAAMVSLGISRDAAKRELARLADERSESGVELLVAAGALRSGSACGSGRGTPGRCSPRGGASEGQRWQRCGRSARARIRGRRLIRVRPGERVLAFGCDADQERSGHRDARDGCFRQELVCGVVQATPGHRADEHAHRVAGRAYASEESFALEATERRCVIVEAHLAPSLQAGAFRSGADVLCG